MAARAAHLRGVPLGTPLPEEGGPPGGLEDLGLVAMVLVVSLLPLASAVAGVGQWDGETLAFGTLGVLFALYALGTRRRVSREPAGRP